MITHTYRMVLTWSAAGHYWIAEAPELGAVSADGQTPEEALAHLQEALQVSLSVAAERGVNVPLPKTYEELVSEEDAAATQVSASA